MKPSPITLVRRPGFSIVPIPLHSDLDARLERQFPRTDGGRIRLPRRQLALGALATGGALLGTNVTTGCRDACGNEINIGEVLIELVRLIAEAFGIGSDVPSESVMVNDSGESLFLKVAIDLIQDDSCTWVKGDVSDVLEIPPGKHMINNSGEKVAPDCTGTHHLDVKVSEAQKPSDTFEVT